MRLYRLAILGIKGMAMTDDIELLQQVRVASPCEASWEEMRGDERVRFCDQCRLNVYDLAAMSAAEAAALVREREGRLCVRFYARRDGTMLVRDCPVGFGAVRRMLLGQLGMIVGAFTLLFSAVPFVTRRNWQAIRSSRLARTEPFYTIFEWLDPTPVVVMGRRALYLPPAPMRIAGATGAAGVAAESNTHRRRHIPRHGLRGRGTQRHRGTARQRRPG